MAELYSDPEVMRFVVGGAVPPAAVRELLEEHLAANRRGSGFYAVEERATGRLVGEVGFGVFDTGEREIGWTFARDRWGRGYATEAVEALLAADGQRVVAKIDRDNSASIKVAEKVGMRRRTETVVSGRPHVVYET